MKGYDITISTQLLVNRTSLYSVVLGVEVVRFLKIRNCESRFLLTVHERRNRESENDSFSIPFTISLLQIPVPIPE